MNDRMAGESSTISTRYDIPVSLDAAHGARYLLLREFGAAEPRFAGSHLEPNGARRIAPHRFTLNQNSRLPQDLPQRQVIPLSNIEDSSRVHDLGSSGDVHLNSPRIGSLLVSSVEQQRNAGVS